MVARNVRSTAAPSVPTRHWAWWLVGAAALTVTVAQASEAKKEEKKEEKTVGKASAPVDYAALRADLEALMVSNPKYDDGHYGPLLLRLAWHAAGHYDKKDGSGGSGSGATMRYSPEAEWDANAGLKTARDLLEPLKAKYPGVSYADLWSLAGAVAVESMGGPRIAWRAGRSDHGPERIVPDGRLPDAKQGVDHLRAIFGRMGFTDQEIVALAGAHAVGRCHRDRSGFDGPWTNSPTMFTNDYFVQLLGAKWTERKWDGPLQFEDESKKLMMLPADMALLKDPEFLKWVKAYAKDEQVFFKDFASAFQKLQELGVKFPETPKKADAPKADALKADAPKAEAPKAAAKEAPKKEEQKPWWKVW